MKKCHAAALLLAGFAALTLVVVPTVASAQSRGKDKPGFTYCQSGAKVADIKNCKENGGKK